MVKSTEHRRDLGYSPAPEIPPVQKNQIIYQQTSPAAAAAKSLQSCLTLCDPIDGSPPGSAVPGILQARTLEWVAIAFSETSPSHPQICFPFWLSSVCWRCNHHLCSHHGIVSVHSHPKSSQSPSSVILSPRFCSLIAPFLHPHCHCDISGLRTVALDKCNSC